MATRQEIQVGHDLIHFINRINDNIWCTCHILQSIHPYTGHPLMITPAPEVVDGIAEKDREINVAEIKEEIVKNSDIIKGFTTKIDGFIAKFDIIKARSGLQYYNVDELIILSDLQKVKTAEGSIATNTLLVSTKSELSNIGISNLPTFDLDINIETIHRPYDIRYINIANDCLDATSYELQGINSYSGEAMSMPVSTLIALAKDRCKVATIEVSKASSLEYTADIQNILAVSEYVSKESEKCRNLNQLANLGQYIDTNIPKLPLVRRHWSL